MRAVGGPIDEGTALAWRSPPCDERRRPGHPNGRPHRSTTAAPSAAKICLRVRRGHIFGFLGPNGAGKSTFIKMMVGLHRPTSESGELLGRPLSDFRARQSVGFLPENFRYQEWLSPRELLPFHGSLLGMETPAGAMRRHECCRSRTGRPCRRELRAASARGCSSGSGFACALLSDPELLFLDDDLRALDPLRLSRGAVELLVRVRNEERRSSSTATCWARSSRSATRSLSSTTGVLSRAAPSPSCSPARARPT